MVRIVTAAAAALALLAPAAAFALDCARPEVKHRSEISGEQSCIAAIVKGAPHCAPGRKPRAMNRVKQIFACEADPSAAKCPAPEQEVKDRYGNEYCKPSGGQCGPGRKHETHHRMQDVVTCVADKSGGDRRPETRLSCKANEREYTPTNKSIKPFCEAVLGRCGSLRVAVKSAVPGHDMCIDK